MNKLLLSIAAFGLAFNIASAEIKVVTVSMQKLFDGYYKSAESNQRLDSVRQQAVAEAQSKEKVLEETVQKINAFQEEMENPMLSDDARRQKEQEHARMIEEARRMQAEYQQWTQRTMNDLNQRGQQIRLELVGEIREVVKTVALRQGAQLIFDTSDILGSGVPTVLFADPMFDITDVVMREINRNAPNK
jgi:outer membrane protein